MSAPARFDRRRFVVGSALGLGLPSRGVPGALAAERSSDFDVVELTLAGEPNFARRCSLIVPRLPRAPRVVPLLVLGHGLGETSAERLGVRAWLEPYGLGAAWRRLIAPPLTRAERSDWSEAELAELNRSLAERPFSGFVIACPFMPNPYGAGGPGTRIERYARWLEEALLPAVRERAPIAARDAAHTGIAGVSLGGMVAIEVFLARSELFGSFGTIQGAFDLRRALDYARRIGDGARTRSPSAFVATSAFDPYRAANRVFYDELRRLGVRARFSLRRGAHSQGWLRDVGSLEALLWHDRALRGAAETGEAGGS